MSKLKVINNNSKFGLAIGRAHTHVRKDKISAMAITYILDGGEVQMEVVTATQENKLKLLGAIEVLKLNLMDSFCEECE